MNICTKCNGAGGYTLDCGCSYDCARCLGTGHEPTERNLSERERLAIEDTALAALVVESRRADEVTV
jgi:hypothetical protein